MMGGDFAPLEAVKGLQRYYAETADPVTVLCIGNEQKLAPLFEAFPINSDRFQVIHAPEEIEYREHPTKALKEKPNSSIAVGFKYLASGKAEAFISAGNTGAMLVGTMMSIKTVEGIIRPAIPTVIPKVDGSTGLLLDVGLNMDCKPEQLNQFAILGSLYVSHLLQIQNPRVALLNIGEEETKGNALLHATYPLLKNNPHINFIGNIEGRDLFQDKTDVTVCDGYTGNIILKLAESIYDIAVQRNVGDDAYFHRFHYEDYGGTPVLGVDRPVIIAHGISKAKAFKNMIMAATHMIESRFSEQIREKLTHQ